jgi:hypothetical protein
MSTTASSKMTDFNVDDLLNDLDAIVSQHDVVKHGNKITSPGKKSSSTHSGTENIDELLHLFDSKDNSPQKIAFKDASSSSIAQRSPVSGHPASSAISSSGNQPTRFASTATPTGKSEQAQRNSLSSGSAFSNINDISLVPAGKNRYDLAHTRTFLH